MAALTTNTGRPTREGRRVDNVPVDAAAHVRIGSLLEISAAGNVKPAVKGAGKSHYGIALTEADNSSGAAGAVTCDVDFPRVAHFQATGTAVRGKTAYAADDNTVTDVAAGASSCGRIVDVDDDGVWVEF